MTFGKEKSLKMTAVIAKKETILNTFITVVTYQMICLLSREIIYLRREI